MRVATVIRVKFVRGHDQAAAVPRPATTLHLRAEQPGDGLGPAKDLLDPFANDLAGVVNASVLAGGLPHGDRPGRPVRVICRGCRLKGTPPLKPHHHWGLREVRLGSRS